MTAWSRPGRGCWDYCGAGTPQFAPDDGKSLPDCAYDGKFLPPDARRPRSHASPTATRVASSIESRSSAERPHGPGRLGGTTASQRNHSTCRGSWSCSRTCGATRAILPTPPARGSSVDSAAASGQRQGAVIEGDSRRNCSRAMSRSTAMVAGRGVLDNACLTRGWTRIVGARPGRRRAPPTPCATFDSPTSPAPS